ncbi:MAG: 2-oxoacid:acceptor oxidoreductase family protein [Syntrophobacteraceae bacterium]
MDRNVTEQLTKQILITGFGGQGIVLAGQVMGMAASLIDHKESTLTQSYGPEARGGACSAQVIISDSPIHYPYVQNPDILVCMSQAGYDKYGPLLKEDGVLLYDQDMVKSPETAPGDSFAIPATRMAEELGRKMMANIVMLGFFTAATGAVSQKAMLKAVSDSVPRGTEQANAAAFTKGYDFGLAILKARRKKAAGMKGSGS